MAELLSNSTIGGVPILQKLSEERRRVTRMENNLSFTQNRMQRLELESMELKQGNIELVAALADVYEELLPEKEEMLADFYVKLVEAGKKEIDDVPGKVKDAVRDELEEKGIIEREEKENGEKEKEDDGGGDDPVMPGKE